MKNIFNDSVVRVPVDAVAGMVGNQSGCVSEDEGVSDADLNFQAHKMIATKRKEIGLLLNIVTFRNKKNMMRRCSVVKDYIKDHPQSELLNEWHMMGLECHRILQYLHNKKKVKKC